MMVIEKLTVEDINELSVLYEELVGRKTDLAMMHKNIEKILANEDYRLIGAKDENGELLGSVMGIVCTDIVGECRPFLVVENVIVSSEARGKGIGKLLMQDIEAFAREKNCSYLMLVSLQKRTGAHAFYEALGYAETPVRGFKKLL